jgi:hypothetical protein
MLIKNCFIWQWNEDGMMVSESEGRVISGELVFLAYLSVDHYGRISKLLLSAPHSSLDESLYETVVDARHRVLLPGLIDSHLHVMSTGESAYYLDLDHCRSIQELQQALRRHHEQNPNLPWIIGINWDQVSPSPHPRLTQLPDQPIPLSHQVRPRCSGASGASLPLESVLAHWCRQHPCPPSWRDRPLADHLHRSRGRGAGRCLGTDR